MYGEVARKGLKEDTFLKVLPVIAVIAFIIPMLANGVAGETRGDDILYIGSIDGEGDDGNIVLAGYRWYTCSFTFIDWIEGIADSRVTMTYNDTTEVDLFRYIPTTENLTMLDLSGSVDVKDPVITIQQGVNMTFSFKIWVHMTWAHSSQVMLEPEIWNDTAKLGLDSTNLLRFDIKGELKVVQEQIRVIDTHGSQLISGQDVKAGSTITVTGISFVYDDSLDRFDDLSPSENEFTPLIMYENDQFDAEYLSGAYHCDVLVPDVGDGRIELSIDIPVIRANWIYAVDNWRFAIDIDGIGPKIELMIPLISDPVGEPTFNWTIKITDRPSPQDVNVNGSRVSYRVWTNTEDWTDWMVAETNADSQSINVEGSALGERGSNNTKVQFRAYDILGNVNISEEFTIKINLPPQVMDLSSLEGLTLQTNESLVLDGTDYVLDPDGDILDFIWYLDDSEPLSTRKDFRKPLFDVEPGEHTVMFLVKDDFETMQGSFNIVVVEQPKEVDERSFLEKLWDDENFFWYILPVAVILILVPLIIIIIAISKKMSSSKQSDFIIDEDRNYDQSEAAKRIIDSMNQKQKGGPTFDDDYTAEAELDTEGFDFDYNLYDVLGLESTATEVEIKKSYRKLAAYFHPDRVTHHKEVAEDDAREEMVKINKAKEILLDPEFKSNYDTYLSEMDFSMDISDMDDEEDEEDFEDEWE